MWEELKNGFLRDPEFRVVSLTIFVFFLIILGGICCLFEDHSLSESRSQSFLFALTFP